MVIFEYELVTAEAGDDEHHEEKLAFGSQTIAAEPDTRSLLIPKLTTLAQPPHLGNASETIDLTNLNNVDFADAVSGVDASDIEVTELDSGWAVKFLGDAQVPTLNLHFNLPGVATEVERALDFVAKENARQTIALPLGFDEISVSYGDQSSLIDLRPFQLTGNEDHHDFPIQHTENDLSSLFSGIPVLENARVNAQVEEDTSDYLTLTIAMPSGQETYQSVRFTPIETGLVNATVITSTPVENRFTVAAPDSSDAFTFAFASGLSGGDQLTFSTKPSALKLQQSLLTYARDRGLSIDSVLVSEESGQWTIGIMADDPVELYVSHSGGAEALASAVEQEITDRHLQRITLPSDTAIEVSVNGETTFIYTQASEPEIKSALESLTSIYQASIIDEDSFWSISLYDPTTDGISNYPVLQFRAADAQIDNVALATAYKTIERRDATGVFSTEFSVETPDQHAVYDYETVTDSGEIFTSAVQVIEREVPRALLKDVWAIDDAGNAYKTGEQDWFLDPKQVVDLSVDDIRIHGSAANDHFLIGNQILNRDDVDAKEIQYDVMQITHTREYADASGASSFTSARQAAASDQVVIQLRSLSVQSTDDERVVSGVDDIVNVDAGAGDDTLIAGLVPNAPTIVAGDDVMQSQIAAQLGLVGGIGNDWIVGSRGVDRIEMGSGSDRVTGNEGSDEFVGDPVSVGDLLLEARSGSFTLSDQELSITYLKKTSDASGDEVVVRDKQVTEREDVSLFESFVLYGGAGIDNFATKNFTKDVMLDGTEGGDNYKTQLSGQLGGASNVRVLDSGSLSTDTDRLEIQGGDEDDTLHLDVIASSSDYQLNYVSITSPLQLQYNGVTTAEINVNFPDTETKLLDQRRAIESALEALDGVIDVIVSGEGTNLKPWKVVLVDGDKAGGEFYPLQHVGTNTQVISLQSAIVERLDSGVADALLAGAPNVDAMFENPLNEQQIFFRRGQWPDNLKDLPSTSFTLEYNGQPYEFSLDHSALPQGPNNQSAQITAFRDQLQATVRRFDSSATIQGTGTDQDPWAINLINAATDRHDNFHLITLSHVPQIDVGGQLLNLYTDPVDRADAAAQTRASADLSLVGDFQRVYYNFTVETVKTYGRGGDDTFIVDDTAAAVDVYGDGGAGDFLNPGNDNFLIGRVLKTTTVIDNGVEIEIVDELSLIHI